MQSRQAPFHTVDEGTLENPHHMENGTHIRHYTKSIPKKTVLPTLRGIVKVVGEDNQPKVSKTRRRAAGHIYAT